MNKRDYDYIKKHATDYICRVDIYGKEWCTFFCGDINFNTVAITDESKAQIVALTNEINRRTK